MSRAYSLACKTCKKRLWVGQGRPSERGYFYKPVCEISALEKFLFAHQGHDLVFGDDDRVRPDDFDDTSIFTDSDKDT